MLNPTASEACVEAGMLIAHSTGSYDSAVARALRGRAADLQGSHLSGGIGLEPVPLLPSRVGDAPNEMATCAVELDRLGLLFTGLACKSSQTDGSCDN